MTFPAPVIKHIPVGSSFEEATQILRAAGFKISFRGESKTLPGHYGVVAQIDEYKKIFLGKITMSVWVEVASEVNLSHVAKVDAEILKQTL